MNSHSGIYIKKCLIENGMSYISLKKAFCDLWSDRFSFLRPSKPSYGNRILAASGVSGKRCYYTGRPLFCQWAFFEKDFNRIQIRCAVGNQPSNAIPQRLGFTLEGTERDGELLSFR